LKTPDINRVDLDINAIAQEIGMGRLQIIFLQNEIMKLRKQLEGAEMDNINGVSENQDNEPSMA